MPGCFSSFRYLELFQFFPCFSGDRGPGTQRTAQAMLSLAKLAAATWTSLPCRRMRRVPSPAVTEQSQAEECQMPQLILCLHFDGADLLPAFLRVAGCRADPIQFLRDYVGQPQPFPSVQTIPEQHWVFLQQEKDGQTWTLHACLSTLMSCMYCLRNRNEQSCFFQLVCYVHYSKKNNKHSILWFLSLCTKQFREYVLSAQPILSLSLVKFMKVSDTAQIAAWSRTFMLDNPLETVTLNMPVNTFCWEAAISSEHWLFPPAFPEETAITEWKIIVKLGQHQEARKTNCFLGQNYLHRTFEREQNV